MQSLETEILRDRDETFATETLKNGSRDRDQVSRLHHCGKIFLLLNNAS